MTPHTTELGLRFVGIQRDLSSPEFRGERSPTIGSRDPHEYIHVAHPRHPCLGRSRKPIVEPRSPTDLHCRDQPTR
jgi:hypothetical protein